MKCSLIATVRYDGRPGFMPGSLSRVQRFGSRERGGQRDSGMAINYKKLVQSQVQLCEECGKQAGVNVLREAFQERALHHRDFDFGKLFSECFGHDRYLEGKNGELASVLMEAAGAVTTAAFQNISGQIIFSAVLEGFNREELVISKLIPEVQTPFSGEKIPGISNLGTGTFAVSMTCF